jgi:hypothetical protein
MTLQLTTIIKFSLGFINGNYIQSNGLHFDYQNEMDLLGGQ